MTTNTGGEDAAEPKKQELNGAGEPTDGQAASPACSNDSSRSTSITAAVGDALPTDHPPYLLIWDWDDTIFPRSGLRRLQIDRLSQLHEQLLAELRRLEQRAIRVLEVASRFGSLVVVSNATRHWLDTSLGEFMPVLQGWLRERGVRRISAREDSGNLAAAGQCLANDIAQWKCNTFLSEVHRLKGVTRLVAIGDDIYEMHATNHIKRHCLHVSCKKIKLFEQPTIEELSEELRLLEEHLHSWLTRPEDLITITRGPGGPHISLSMDDDLDHLPIRSPSAPLAPLTPLPFARQQQQQQQSQQQNYHQQQQLPPITHPAPTQQQQQQQGQGPSIRIANFMDVSLSGRCSRSSSSNNKVADDLMLDDLEEFHDIDIFEDTSTVREREREREMQRGRLSLPAINSHKRAVTGGQQQQQQQQLGALHGDVPEGANGASGGGGSGSGVVRKGRMSCRSRPPLPPQSRPSKGAGGAGIGAAGGAAAEQTMINGTHDETEGARLVRPPGRGAKVLSREQQQQQQSLPRCRSSADLLSSQRLVAYPQPPPARSMSSSATASIRPPPSPPCFSADTGGTAETQQNSSSNNNNATSNDKAKPISPPALPQPSPQPYTPTTASPPIRCSVPNGTDPHQQQHHHNNRGNASSRLLQTMIGFFHHWGGGGGQHGGRDGEDRRATARQVAATCVSGGRRETNKEARVRSLSFDRSSARKPLASSPPPHPPPPPPPPPAPKLASACGVPEGSPPLPPIVTLSIPQPEEEGNRPVTPHSQSDERKPLLDWDGDGEVMAVSDPKRARSHPDRRLVSFSSLDISAKLPLPPSLTDDGPSAPHIHPHMHPDKEKAETTVERGRTHTNAVSTRSTSIGNEAGALESRVTDEGWEGESGGRVVACSNPFHTPEQQQEDTGEEKEKQGEGGGGGEEGEGVLQPSVDE
ncbi:unnamed protein product [Vitrella brassicaformis CCMP3155]|uniref:Uncharacterized protein n=3 Tax=Vitrella brassicaformis TaxID=1169539 RepID=A0A0G4FKP5_VITBC|nr:unnamed protein product [Vitrella brassicaformis CCMP3155]|eukprot:CEM13900.1 unnamed protein product [Vitrella brassicaformis CCMP3155]